MILPLVQRNYQAGGLIEMKKFEMPEVQVVTFEEEVLSGVTFLSSGEYLAQEANGLQGTPTGLF